MSRDITPFGVRMPSDLKDLVDAAAATNKRSINAEVVARIQHSFAPSNLDSIPTGTLIEELVDRLGAKLQIVVSKDVAEAAGIQERRVDTTDRAAAPRKKR